MARAGRPRQGKETKVRYNVMLEPAIAEWLRKYGGDNLSAGIQALAVRAMLGKPTAMEIAAAQRRNAVRRQT
jgi:hypothetical protein